jgi:hypothetical protein
MRTPDLKRIAVVLLLTGAFIITLSVLLSAPIGVAGASGFGTRCGAKGAYGYTGFGTAFDGNPLGFPAGIVSSNGTLTLDGNGNVVIHEVEVASGQVFNPDATFSGTYTLNPDCTFAATLPGLPGPVFVGVVVDNGKQIRAMSTIPGVQVNYISTFKVHPENDSR